MKNKHTTLTDQAKIALVDIFNILENKFVEQAQTDDVLYVRPDVEKKSIICALAKYDNDIKTPFNKQFLEDMTPYFLKLKEQFTPEVLLQFMQETWEVDLYMKDSANILTDQFINKIKDPQYKPKKMKM